MSDSKPKFDHSEELFFSYLGMVYGEAYKMVALSSAIACEAMDKSPDSRAGMGMSRDEFLATIRTVTERNGGEPNNPDHLLQVAKALLENIVEKEREYQDRWAPQAAANGGPTGQAHMIAMAMEAAQSPGGMFQVADHTESAPAPEAPTDPDVKKASQSAAPVDMRGFFMLPKATGGDIN
jgi:hypothetical protein